MKKVFMKKINLLFIAIIFFACSARAQFKREYVYVRNSRNNFYDYDYTLSTEFKISSKEEKKKIAKAGIKDFTQTIKHGKKEYVWAKINFDSTGNCTSAIFNKENEKVKRQFLFTYSPENLVLSKTMLNGKGKEIKKKTFKYNSDSLATETVFYRRGKEIKKNTYAINKFHQYTEQEYYKKGKIKTKVGSKYDSTRVQESYYYKNGSPDYKWKWIYTYYEDKSRKASVIYKADGSVKYSWNYECKPEGELVSKHKDSTLVCQKVEFDNDSNRTYTYREFNEKGKPSKVVAVYSKNLKMLQYEVYHDIDVPSYFYKYNKATGEYEQQIYYNHKGKERSKFLSVFDNSNNIIEMSFYHKGKLITKSERHFSTLNFVTSEILYKKNNKIESSNKFDYSLY